MNWLGWTEENIAHIIRRFHDGRSAGQTAKEIGAPSRNAVLMGTQNDGCPRRAAPLAFAPS